MGEANFYYFTCLKYFQYICVRKMGDFATSSTEELSDDDLPDVPLMQRIAQQNTANGSKSSATGFKQKSKPSHDPPVATSEDVRQSSWDGNGTPQSTLPSRVPSTSIPPSSRVPPSFALEISDDDDDEDDDFPLIPTKVRKMADANAPSKSVASSSSVRFVPPSSSSSSTSICSGTSSTDLSAPTNVVTANDKKLAKQEEKRRKEEEKLQKKLEKEREAANKKAEAQRKKALKPGEAPKCIVVDLDAKLLEAQFGGLLLQEIQALGAGTQIEPHPVGLSDTIFFWRRDPVSMDNVSGENDNDENKTLELFCIVYLTAKEFVSLVANGKNEKAGITPASGLLSPRQFVESKAAKLKDVKLTLIIDGIEKHFRNVKTLQQREYRQRVNGQKSGMTAVWTDVSRLDVEESKIELQLFHGVHVVQVETKEEFAAAVVRFTKSVAERPHKQMVQGHAGGLFSFCADNSATSVKPNAIGEGLLKAWKKQLTQFTLISDDVANAVVAAYSSPQLLRSGFRSSPNPSVRGREREMTAVECGGDE